MTDIITVDEALSKLKEGNRRFTGGANTHPHQGLDRCREVFSGQKPFAAILGCSDSRVPLEVIFDQGIGDLFVVRVAGNVADDIVTASIEYAVDHLHVPLVVVLGHQNCGAVQAAIQGGAAHGSIPALMKALDPAVKEGKDRGGNNPVEETVRANIRLTVAVLNHSPVIAGLKEEGRIEVAGGYYSLETGKVDFL